MIMFVYNFKKTIIKFLYGMFFLILFFIKIIFLQKEVNCFNTDSVMRGGEQFRYA